MKARTKLVALCTLLIAFVMSLCAAGTMLAFAATEVPTSSQDDWTDVPPTWQFTEDGIVGTNEGFLSNYLLTETDDTVGDYSVTATFTGTASQVTKEIHFGIVPWYLDAQNYVIVYGQWKTDKATSLACVEVLYFKDGIQYGTEGNKGWNDHWLDNLYTDTLFTLHPTDTITMTVTKEYNGSGMDTYTVALSGTNSLGTPVSATISPADSYSVSVPHAATQAKVGLYTQNDTFTVSDFATNSLSGTGEYKMVSGTDTTGKSATATGWSYADSAYTVDASSGTAADNQAIYQNTNTSGNYAVSYTANCTAASGNVLSVLPYFASDDNYARFVITQAASGAELAIEGEANGVAFDETFAAYEGAIDWSSVDIRATKVGANVNLYIGSDAETPVATYTTSFTDGANVGFGAAGGSVTFANVQTAPEGYQPYDWFISGAYYMSAQAEDSITVEDGSVTMTVDPDEATNYTRFYTASNRYNNVTVSGSFTVTENAANASYGLYLYYVSDTEYVSAVVTANKLTLTAVSGGTPTVWTYTFAEPITLTAEHTLAVAATFDAVTVTFDGQAVTFDDETAAEVEVAMLAGLETCNVGMLAMGGSITADFSIGGFTPYQNMPNGSWSVSGARLNSWTVSSDGSTLSNTTAGGTTFKQTNALTTSPLVVPSEGYYLATAVQVTEQINSEWKYGFIAYSGNGVEIYVWLSQWAGNSTTITMNGTRNGGDIDNPWRETNVPFSLTDINYFEVYVHGDTVDVYLNRQFVPVASTTFAGLGNETAGQYGLNAFNVAATFDDVQISTERIFTIEDNVIINIGSSFPKTGTVGKAVNLGVITASLETQGTSVPTQITVTGPNDESVTVTGVRFTPETAGTYTVTITAEDAWGNSATETRTITVTEGTTDPGTDPDDPGTDPDNPGTDPDNPGTDPNDPEEPGDGLSTGAIIGIILGCAAAAAVVVIVVIVVKKKKADKPDKTDEE